MILASLRAMLYAAIDDGLIVANPAARLGRTLRLVTPASVRQERIKAMDRAQLAAFLDAIRTHPEVYVRRHYPLFLALARTGLRLGEARALQWEDLDVDGRTVRVARAFSDDRLGTPKTGAGRGVGMSRQLAAILGR